MTRIVKVGGVPLASLEEVRKAVRELYTIGMNDEKPAAFAKPLLDWLGIVAPDLMADVDAAAPGAAENAVTVLPPGGRLHEPHPSEGTAAE